MKKRIACLLFLFIILLFNVSSYSKTKDFYELQFKVINNNENKNFDIYLLLPEEYIEFVIENDGLEIEYTGIDTLKNNYIPSINIDKSKLQEDTYKEDGVEYIQILLDKDKKETVSYTHLTLPTILRV